MHVCKRMCSTCVYRPDSPAFDTPIKRIAVEADNAVICHATLDLPEQAVCAGFWQNENTTPIALAKALGRFRKVELPKPHEAPAQDPYSVDGQ